MDNEFADLEAELLRLQPRQPGARLEARLAHELEPGAATAPVATRSVVADRRAGVARPRYRTATTWTSWKWSNWAVAAALVALMLTLNRLAPLPDRAGESPALVAQAETAGPVGAPELRPVKAGRVLLGSRSDGVVELADGSAVERVRDYFVDTIEWRDVGGTAQLRWEVPREAVRYVGLAAY